MYKRKVTGAERFFYHSPFSTVTMVARIKGLVTREMLEHAVLKVQKRHILLGVRIEDKQYEGLWFTSNNVGSIPIEVVNRQSDEDWIKIHAEGAKIPFDFDNKPAIRFILAQSPAISDLIILCHHTICDGMSLAYLARDLMIHLGNPELEPKVLPASEPISMENLPKDALPSCLIRFFIKRIKQKWADEIVFFNQKDYEAINEAYWDNFNHQILSIELSEEKTKVLVARCRAEKVTVNTALIAAFSGAQQILFGKKPHHSKTASAVSLRARLPHSPGEGMGYYALGLEVKFDYKHQKSFWENARRYHKKIGTNIPNKRAFGDLPAFLLMDSNIYEALNFKKLGKLVRPEFTHFEKLHSFSKMDDVIIDLLKRAGMETLETKLLGTAVTNLGRLDFSREYGNLELDRLIMQPGGAFPLVHVDMVVGAVTCAGKLSLIVEYAEEAVDPLTMKKVKDQALNLLFSQSN